MEVIALLAVIAFFAGGKYEDTSLKIMLISKMFIAVATVIFRVRFVVVRELRIIVNFDDCERSSLTAEDWMDNVELTELLAHQLNR